MNVLRWISVLLVLPTFGVIAYWMWRYSKASGLGRLPRTLDEMKPVDAQFKDDFARAAKRLRWFNLWLLFAFVAAVIIASVLTRK